jgi:hypothetical protein
MIFLIKYPIRKDPKKLLRKESRLSRTFHNLSITDERFQFLVPVPSIANA